MVRGGGNNGVVLPGDVSLTKSAPPQPFYRAAFRLGRRRRRSVSRSGRRSRPSLIAGTVPRFPAETSYRGRDGGGGGGASRSGSSRPNQPRDLHHSALPSAGRTDANANNVFT
ncbi:unnamed protein product [Macrosiphum euphorbiae]|uniref:Uncharacterized protein n=1 Tax=Macrosiphum euphorbiae TaxID=13131 RepID=A0AAV0WJ32_9HEMI|nr:unnamed protein product [Macrosiphum euphorbiae]